MKAALAIFTNRFGHVSAIVLLLCGSFLTAQDAQGSGQQSQHPEANSYSGDSRTAQENAVDWKTKGITPPRATYAPLPELPENARKTMTQGKVTVAFTVATDGKTCDIKIKKRLTPELDQEAVKTAASWRFDPATKEGKPVAMRIDADVSFTLDGK
jgi:TonB family protein